jgi:hypothetical protein
MIEFATLNDIKDYLEIPQEITEYDSKLSMLLAAGNSKCEKVTGESETDPVLKVSVCKYVDFNFSRKTGAESESDKDSSVKYKVEDQFGRFSDVPAEVMSIWEDYIDGDEEEKGQGTISVDLI